MAFFIDQGHLLLGLHIIPVVPSIHFFHDLKSGQGLGG